MGAQSLFIVLALSIMWLRPHALDPRPRDRDFVKLVDTLPPINHTPAPVPPARPAAEVKLQQPSPPVIQAIKVSADTKPRPRVADQVATPVLMPTKAVSLPATIPPLPRPPVKTNVFSTGSSAPATIDRAAAKVQTGGFGDPNGIPAHDDSRSRPVNIARLGSFDLPMGGGQGNGTGGTHGASGVVGSSGFGNGTATGNRSGRQNGPAVEAAGFASSEPAAGNQGREQRAKSVTPTVVPAEILFKPTPAYTAEGRRLRIEGEVLLEVVFQASGGIRVTRLVRGLGHGLDESAVQAAEQIRFKPALRDGQPSDSTGILHIVFQLA